MLKSPLCDGQLYIDLMTLRREIEKLPGFSVTARRRWPAEIEVTLIEQHACSLGAQGYLNHEGEHRGAARVTARSLPCSGPEGTEARLMRLPVAGGAA